MPLSRLARAVIDVNYPRQQESERADFVFLCHLIKGLRTGRTTRLNITLSKNIEENIQEATKYLRRLRQLDRMPFEQIIF